MVQLLQLKVTAGLQDPQEQLGDDVDVALPTVATGSLLLVSLLLLLPLLVRRLGGLPAEHGPSKTQADVAPPKALLRVTGALCIGVACRVTGVSCPR